MDGFGLFHDVEVADIPPGLSLFVGDNESGKSTTLAFVHTVLFGYPDGRTRENAYPPLRGGEAGGRLLVHSETAGPLTLERRDGTKGGPLTVTFPDGHSEGEGALSRLLGGVTRSLYRKLYAFSLYELEQLNSLSDESVRDVIYGASLGTTSLSLPEVRGRLESRKGELFKPSGSKPQINSLLKQLEEVRGSLREARRRTGEYEDLSSELAGLEARIESARERLHHSREEHERLKTHMQLWEDWTALQDAETRLAALPEVEAFPEDGLSRLDDLTAKVERETDLLREVEEELKEKGDKLERLTFDARVLEREAEIGTLVRGLGTYEQAVAELPRVQEALKGQRRQVEEVLAEFGAGRTEAWVLAMDRSSEPRGQVEAHREALEAGHRRVEKAADAEREALEGREHLREEAEAANAGVEELDRTLGEEVPPEVLTALRERRTQFQAVLHDLPGVEQQRVESADGLAGALRDISPEWTAETLEAFDTSLTARQKVADSDTQLTEAATRVRETENAVARAEAALTEAEAELQAKTEAVEGVEANEVPLDTLRERKGLIRSLRDAVFRHEALAGEVNLRRQMAQAGAEGPANERGASIGRWLQGLSAVIAGVALVAALALWVNGQQVVGLAAGAVLFLLALALYLTGRAAAAPGDRESAGDDGASVTTTREGLEAAAAEIEDLKQKLELTGDATVSRVNDLEDENTAQLAQAEDLVRLRRELEDLQTTRDRRVEARDAAAEAVEVAKAQRQAEEEAWQGLVGSLQLPAGTSPRTAGEVFSKVETARGLARQMADHDGRLMAMHSARDEYVGLMRQAPGLEKTATEDEEEELLVALTEFLAEAARQEEQRRLLAEAHNAAERAGEDMSVAERRLEQVTDEHKSALSAEEEGRAAWTDWLRERGMEMAWSPETTLRLLERAGRLAELTVARDEAADTADRLQKDQEEYRERVVALCAQLDRPGPPPDKLVAEVHALDTELAESLKQRTLHEALADEMPDLESRRASRKERIEELQGEVRELVEKGDAAGEDEFQSRGRLHEQRRELVERISEYAERVRKAAGTTELTALREELEDKSQPGLTVAGREARDRVEELEADLGGLQQERARCDERRRQLLDEDDVARLRAEEESLLEQFLELSQDWARHAAALHLLSVAKDRFEQSHQPEVIHRAGEYFRKITDGRYKQVFAPHGEQTIEVIDRHDRRVAVEALSRGTSEQLYLAIRFGYIASQDAEREQLPLLMDDVMVNFDPRRAAQAARGILEVAERQQVLFFSCHPEMVEVFRGHRGDVPVYELAGGTIGQVK